MSSTTVDSILQEFRDDILNNVNAKECAPELRRQKVIAESTETDIERARDARKASGILYDHLCRNCTYEQIVVFSRVLMEVDDGYGRMKNVGYRLHARIQEGGAVASDPKVSPDESPLHPSTHKAEVNTETVNLPLEDEEKTTRESKQPTFGERNINTYITDSGFYKWKYVHSAEAVDVDTGIRVKAKHYKSEGGAKEHARANLKAKLLAQGIIRKD